MKFKKGDVVRIRGWEEMVKEFGMAGPNINCPGIFSKYMKPLCGKSAVVEECNEKNEYYVLRPMAIEDMAEDWEWDFTDEMLKE